jgi:ABA DEFICIENT 4-like
MRMALDTLFQLCTTTAMAGWLVLLASPIAPTLADRISGLFIPTLLAIFYAGLVMAFWTRAEGGFDSLPNVMRLFTKPEIALAGWIHYLAFDLLVGAWEVRTAREDRIPFILVVPCLLLTFLFGPAGYLAFVSLRAARTITPLARSHSGRP